MASARTKTTFVHFNYIFHKREKSLHYTYTVHTTTVHGSTLQLKGWQNIQTSSGFLGGRIRLRAGSGFFADFLGKKPESTLEIWIPWGNPVSSTLDPSGDPESLDPMAGSR